MRSIPLVRRSTTFLMAIVVLCCTAIGWSAARAMDTTGLGTVDPVPQNQQLGQSLYLQTCGGCHIVPSPAVLPDETWRQLLQDTQHYGVQLAPIVDPPRLLIWNYLRAFSRPIAEGESVPYRINNSRYFKALHPRVPLPQPATLGSCISCHPGAGAYDFRSLSAEWQNAP
ncbi:MAG: diheme cytochrome C [Leptolyngbyaceae cyanobacterium SM1_3_5]|nr:diheme cytochrome C [Leptolyngbyaceae cyanobacterium SM1_3_5]